MDNNSALPSQQQDGDSNNPSQDDLLVVDDNNRMETLPIININSHVDDNIVNDVVETNSSSSPPTQPIITTINRVKSPTESTTTNQQGATTSLITIPSLPLSGVRIASPSSSSSATSHLNITTTSARVPNSYDLFNSTTQSSATTATSSSSLNSANNDLAISFFIPSSPSQNNNNNQQLGDSSRDSFSFSPQLIGSSSTSNRRQKQSQQQQQQQHQCNEQCNHNISNEQRKTKSMQLGNNVWRRLQRGIRSFKRIFCSGQEADEGDMPLLVIAQDMSVRIHLFSTMFLNWFKTLIVFVIGFVLNLKHLISTGGYKQIFTKKNISDNLNNLSSWVQSLQNTNPEAHWLLGNIQQFVSFFISPLSLTSSRNYSLSFQQHHQLKTHFLFCVIILTFSILEIFIGMVKYGSTHNHESAKSNNEEQENIVQSFRNHGFMASLLILFSGFYLLHRGFMFLIDLIVIYIKTTHEENTLQGSSSSVITKSSLSQPPKTLTSNSNNTFDSPIGPTATTTTSFGDNSTLEEEGSIKRLLFQPYTYSLWKRLRVLLRFANAVFSSFLSLSIFSEMIQYVLTSKFSSHEEEKNDGVGLHIPPTLDDDSTLSIDNLLEQYRVGIFTYLLVIFGLFINGLSIYLFGNYSGSSSYQAKKNEEDFLLLSSAEKRKNPSSSSNRGSVPLNRMNSSPMWFQQFSSFNSVFNTSQTSTIGRYYNTIHNYIREKVPSAKFWIYIVMREAHIHVALLIYLKTVYYSSAGIGFDFVLCCMSTMTCLFFSLPVLKANGKILLQTTPENLSNHLNSCVKEVSSMVEGVLECHSEHFWALNCSSLDEADEEDVEIDADKRKQELIATIKVRVANNVQVDHQRVLQSVRRIFCSNGLLKEHNLTVQVEKNTILGLEKIYQDDE